jgi:replicative DNA helicase
MAQRNPHIIPNQVIEQELLGAFENSQHEMVFIRGLMGQPSLIDQACGDVDPEHLTMPVMRAAYEVMLMMHGEQAAPCYEPEALVAMSRRARVAVAKRLWESVDGTELLTDLYRHTPTPSADRFLLAVREIQDRWVRIQLYRKSRAAQLALLDLTNNPVACDVGLALEGDIGRLVAATNTEDDLSLLALEEENFWMRSQLSHQHPHLHIHRVNIPEFPQWMRTLGDEGGPGFKRPGCHILAARTKAGKSTMLLNLAYLVSTPRPITLEGDVTLYEMDGETYSNAIPVMEYDEEYNLIPSLGGRPVLGYSSVPVLYLDTEMVRGDAYNRALALASGLREQEILGDKLYNESATMQQVEQAIAQIRDRRIYYANIAGKDASHVVGIMRRFRDQIVGTQTVQVELNGKKRLYTISNPSFVIYDWLKLPENGNKDSREYIEFGHLTAKIGDAARKLDLVVLAGAQHNQTADTGQTTAWSSDHLSGAIAASDRIKWFAISLSHLRNLTSLEVDETIGRFGTREKASGSIVQPDKDGVYPAGVNLREGRSAPLFNQIMVVTENRHGDTNKRGIPYHHDFGAFRYEECVLLEDGGHGVKQDIVQPWLLDKTRPVRKGRAANASGQGKVGLTTAITLPDQPSVPGGVA